VGQTKAEVLQVNRRYIITDPLGKTIEIPETAADDFAYFDVADAEGLRSYYEREGYVVVRGLIGPNECDHAQAIFEREVKPMDSFIYRQATANPERLSTPDMAIC
jgi:phytanoyl-CoA hydroxylase